MARFKRTELFMRISDGEDSTLFVPVSDYIGKESPHKRPLAIAAVAVSDSGVYFSLLHPTKKNVGRYTAEVTFPSGPLGRLERKASVVDSTDSTTLFVSIDDKQHELTISTDQSGLATITDSNNVVFELPVRGIMMDMYWWAPKIKRRIAFTFTGNFGRPGTEDTLERIVSMAVNSLSGLADFRAVSGINHVEVPPAKSANPTSSLRRAEVDHVDTTVAVWLYKDDGQPLVGGEVAVYVDLANANPSLPVLMCRYTPSATIEAVFHPYMHSLDRAIASHVTEHLGADFVEIIVCDIVLGEVDQRTVNTITETFAAIQGVKLTPSRYEIVAA